MAGPIDEFVSTLGLEIEDDGLGSFQSGLAGAVGKLGLVVAGAFSAAAAISSLLDAAAETNQIAKFSRAIGVGFDRVQELEFAAKQFGIEGSTMRGVLGGLESQLRKINLGEADGFVETLGRLGVSARDASGQIVTSDELIRRIADSIAAVDGQLQRDRLGLAESLGLGVEFTDLLKIGRDGLNDLADEAQRTGAILGDDFAAASERFVESADKLKRAVRVLFVEAGQPLVEWAADGTEALLSFARSEAFAEIKSGFGELSDDVQRFLSDTKELAAFLAGTIEGPEGGDGFDFRKALGIGAENNPVLTLPGDTLSLLRGEIGIEEFTDKRLAPFTGLLDIFTRSFENAVMQGQTVIGGLSDSLPNRSPDQSSRSFGGITQNIENHIQTRDDPDAIGRAVGDRSGESLERAYREFRSTVER